MSAEALGEQSEGYGTPRRQEGPLSEVTHQDLLRKVKRSVDETGDLHARLQFTRATDALKDRRSRIDDLAGRLAHARQRGFRYKAALEGQLDEARRLAPGAVEQVLHESRAVADRLRDRVDEVLARGRRLAADSDLRNNQAQVEMLDDAHDDLKREVDDAERRLGAITDPVVKAVDGVTRGLKEAEDVLEAFEGATFQLQPGEDVLASVGASWEDAQGGAKKGRLFLTDHRVRFEHDEEIVTKKTMFFFAAETKRVQKLVLDEPIGHLASSDDSTRGWVFKEQVLGFAWDRAAKCPQKTSFEVERGSAKEWDTLVESIRDGSIRADRVQGEVQEEEILSFPEQCSACGGALPPAVKGQRTLTCPFCSVSNAPIG